ncbi:MAG TPA: DUF192 domain-containing protein [Acidimicrobiales bacterium]|nr:DUF192 domain-containing protein [Acidimicrobiales bacterium]
MKLSGVRWAVIAVVVLGGLAFVVKGANRPANPSLKPATQPLQRTHFGDFGEIAFTISGGAAQAAAIRCALLADTEAQQELGLMNRTDIGGYDGMLFRFQSDTTVSFYMKDTPLPLSIAFFDGSGQFVSTTDMPPCVDRPSCPLYNAARPYRYALEVPEGALPRLGIGPGTRLVTAGACP